MPLGAVDQHGPASRVLVGDPIQRLPELPIGRWGAIQDRDVGGDQAGGLLDSGARGNSQQRFRTAAISTSASLTRSEANGSLPM